MIENTGELERNSDEENPEPSEQNHKRGRPAVNPIPSEMRRLREASHMPIFIGVINRCRKHGCNKRSSAMCSTCNIIICLS